MHQYNKWITQLSKVCVQYYLAYPNNSTPMTEIVKLINRNIQFEFLLSSLSYFIYPITRNEHINLETFTNVSMIHRMIQTKNQTLAATSDYFIYFLIPKLSIKFCFLKSNMCQDTKTLKDCALRFASEQIIKSFFWTADILKLSLGWVFFSFMIFFK